MTNLTRTYISGFVLAISLLLFPMQTMGQQRNIEMPKDTTRLLKGFEVTYDLAGTAMRIFGSYGQVEGSLRINLKDKFFPAFEFGYGLGDRDYDELTGIHVKTNAPYFRLGCDYNIAKAKHDKYRVTLGLRYGFTKFDFHSDAQIIDPTYGNVVDYNIDESGLTYHWAEVVFGLGAKLWGPVHLGWSLRYKLKIASDEGSLSEVWYIPGFGEEGNKIGGSFNVGVEF